MHNLTADLLQSHAGCLSPARSMAMRGLEDGAVLPQALAMQIINCRHFAACGDLGWHSSLHMPAALYNQSHSLVPHKLDSGATFCGRWSPTSSMTTGRTLEPSNPSLRPIWPLHSRCPSLQL